MDEKNHSVTEGGNSATNILSGLITLMVGGKTHGDGRRESL